MRDILFLLAGVVLSIFVGGLILLFTHRRFAKQVARGIDHFMEESAKDGYAAYMKSRGASPWFTWGNMKGDEREAWRQAAFAAGQRWTAFMNESDRQAKVNAANRKEREKC